MTTPKPGSFVHIELASSDPARSRKFLQDVFAWTFETVPGLEYFPYAAPSGPGGAVVPPADDRPKGVLNYILSEDVARDLQRIERAGGRALGPKREIPGVGWWALFEEPGGCVLALFQPSSLSRGPMARYRSP
jgi:uncharacterized protein